MNILQKMPSSGIYHFIILIFAKGRKTDSGETVASAGDITNYRNKVSVQIILNLQTVRIRHPGTIFNLVLVVDESKFKAPQDTILPC